MWPAWREINIQQTEVFNKAHWIPKYRGFMIRILIADDSPHILDSLSTLVAAQPDFELVGTATDGLEAVEKAHRLMPHVVIMDAQMPHLDGVEATRRIKQECPEVKILFFSVFMEYLEASIAAGSDSYLTKDCEVEELFAEIRRIASDTRESPNPTDS